jgi:adenosylcobinamide-GDP ribazoletransferase
MRGAVTLLTRLPLTVVPTDGPGAAAFGLVGALIGVVGAIPLVLLAGPAGEPWIGALGAVAAIAVVTGGMHLDGLADTADALSAPDAVTAERARKDPSLGAGGVIAIVVVIAAEVAALASLSGSIGAVPAGLALIGVAAGSRVVPVIIVRSIGAATDARLGSWFAERVTVTDALLAVASALVAVALLAMAARILDDRWLAVAASGGGTIALGIGAGAILIARRGALDGDGLGAIVELSVVAGLATAAIVVA